MAHLKNVCVYISTENSYLSELLNLVCKLQRKNASSIFRGLFIDYCIKSGLLDAKGNPIHEVIEKLSEKVEEGTQLVPLINTQIELTKS